MSINARTTRRQRPGRGGREVGPGRDPDRDRGYLAILTDVSEFAAHVPVMDLEDDTRFTRLADLIESNLFQGGR